jgi:hypothetical protein
MTATSPSIWFCSDRSRGIQEPLLATASRTDVWFLIEYTGPWGSKALEESILSESIKSHLANFTSQIDNARTLLIKQEGRRPDRDMAFMVAGMTDGVPFLHRTILPTYEALLDIDLAAASNGEKLRGAQTEVEPLYLVCTNGRRDQCCAKFGLTTYHSLQERLGDRVWQCTHLGGHRFAPNMVVLPRGMVYGRVAPEDLPEVADASRVFIPSFRGRASYDPPAQAAEVFLRLQLNHTQIEGLPLHDINPSAQDRWTVSFKRDGSTYSVEVVKEPTGLDTYDNCGIDKTSPVSAFRLTEIRS